MGPFRLLVSETRASRRLEGKRIRMSFALVATASILASVARAGPGWQCNGPDYIALPAATKLDQIWENCAADQTSAPWLSMLEVGEIMFESMCPTFNTEGDQLPLGWTGNVRQKYIHSVGTVGKVEWVDMGGHPYTGIFQGASRELPGSLLPRSQALLPSTLHLAWASSSSGTGWTLPTWWPCTTSLVRSPGTSLKTYSLPTSRMSPGR